VTLLFKAEERKMLDERKTLLLNQKGIKAQLERFPGF